MPEVFDNSMTAHVWAQQTQDAGRSHNGNFYFEGRTLYSYGSHYVVGHITPDGQAFLNADSSSMTTNGKHKPAARRALSHKGHVVPDLTAWRRDVLAYIGTGHRTQSEILKSARLMALRNGNAGTPCYAWPGVESYSAILQAIGLSEHAANNTARIDAAKVERKQDAAKAQDAARALAHQLDNAKEYAAESSRDISRTITATLGHYANPEMGRDNLAELGRKINRAAKAAKGKGWTRIAAKLHGHYKTIRAAVTNYERHAGAAFRNRETRNGIAQFRRALTDWTAGQVSTGHGSRYSVRPIEGATDTMTSAGRVVQGARYLAARRVPAALAAKLESIAVELDAIAQKAESEIAAERFAKETAARELWHKGERIESRYEGKLSDESGGALIRARAIERDESGAIVGGVLETSWRATVPLVQAVAAFRFLKLVRARGQGWQANGQRIRVGHFQVESIAPDGSFKAACHRFNWAEIERLAVELGVFLAIPSDEILTA